MSIICARSLPQAWKGLKRMVVGEFNTYSVLGGGTPKCPSQKKDTHKKETGSATLIGRSCFILSPNLGIPKAGDLHLAPQVRSTYHRPLTPRTPQPSDCVPSRRAGRKRVCILHVLCSGATLPSVPVGAGHELTAQSTHHPTAISPMLLAWCSKRPSYRTVSVVIGWATTLNFGAGLLRSSKGSVPAYCWWISITF